MITNLLADAFSPRYPKGYVGRHRAPKQQRYVATVRMPAATRPSPSAS